MMCETEDVLEALRVPFDLRASDFDDAAWQRAHRAELKRYWSGEQAPAGRYAEAQLLWNERALVVRFICRQSEPLVISPAPQTVAKTLGLWERDVCEIFIAPDPERPERYFEFEAAPTGEFIDLALEQRPTGRMTDWEFQSGMTAAARVLEEQLLIAMRIPWEAFGLAPRAGERWRVNLFRCVGQGASRGYLAWRPTRTAQPNFHVPQAFGWLEFKESN